MNVVASLYTTVFLLLFNCAVSESQLLPSCNRSNPEELPEIRVSTQTLNESYEKIILRNLDGNNDNESAVFLLGTGDGKGPVGKLELVCSAPYPVQWGFRTFQIWSPWTTTTHHSANSSLYETTLSYPALRNITQIRNDFPTCHKSDDMCAQTSISVGSDGTKPRLKVDTGSALELNPPGEFGKNERCTLNMVYDPTAQTFYCQGSPPDTNITMFPRTCSNPIECRNALQPDDCGDNKAPIIPISNCSFQTNCTKMDFAKDNFLPSVAVCLIRGTEDTLVNSVGLSFFYSLGDKPKRYLSFDQADPQLMMQLSDFQDKLIYAMEPFNLVCNASYYYFSSGMYFQVEPGLGIIANADETLILQPTYGKRGTLVDMPWIRTLTSHEFQIPTPGTYEIQCKAPVWNTTRWITKSTTIKVLETTEPQFLNHDGNETEILPYKAERILTCVVTGTPKPQISWSLNDLESNILPRSITVLANGENETASWSSIKFPDSYGGKIFGNFTCSAQNYAGEAEKTFVIVPGNEDKTFTEIILGVTMGIVGLILVPCLLFLGWKVRNQRKQLQYMSQEEVDEFLKGKPEYVVNYSKIRNMEQYYSGNEDADLLGTFHYVYYLPYDEKAWEIERSDLKIDFQRVLGSGAYGMVVQGLYRNKTEVAVKMTKPMIENSNSSMDVFKALLSELKIMTYIGLHENVVNLIGACTKNIKKREVFIALEYCDFGSLLTFMRTHRHSFTNMGFVPEDEDEMEKDPEMNHIGLTKAPSFIGTPHVQYVKMEDLTQLSKVVVSPDPSYANIPTLNLKNLLRWAKEIAHGMEYLATKKVIHGDLAARNVLLNHKLVAKIADFGLSKRLIHPGSYTRTATTPLPIKWLAIECLQNFQFTAESDVWSYGVVLWEIFSLGEIPYSSFNGSGEQFLEKLQRGMRLQKPELCPVNIFDVMMKCWKHERKKRPKFSLLANFFSKLEDDSHPQNPNKLELRLSSLVIDKKNDSDTSSSSAETVPASSPVPDLESAEEINSRTPII